MLSRVLELVQAQGWFDLTRPHEKTLYLTHGSAHCTILGRDGRPDTFVKFSDLIRLGGEAERCARASIDFRGLAPDFVGHVGDGPLEVLATRAERFRPLTGDMVRSGRDRAAVLAGLERFFTAMRATATAAPADHAWYPGMRHYFEAQGLGGEAARTLRELEPLLPTLPAMPQHGDFVINNLGLRPDRSLVVFDWEDHAAIALPGLDLFTLQTSLARALAEQGLDHPGLAAADRALLCRAMGIAPELYDRLRPACALAFRYLKRNYAPGIRERADELIAEALAA